MLTEMIWMSRYVEPAGLKSSHVETTLLRFVLAS